MFGGRKVVNMKNDLPTRKKIRLNYFDYTKEGMYFITVCIKNKKQILGKINNSRITLTKKGIIVQDYIKNIEKIYSKILIDEYAIMPNHIHILISIKPQNTISISRIINNYKGAVSKQIGYSIWQKSYYEHIVRNDYEYYKIKEYIQNNVVNWKKDKYF